ncbi:prefoldin subunit beta [archaeon]|jgi:prefoldin beta subunit|nr:prefoldin subunit beta [archaeon]MBT6697871.1 prefoldin subunit beta [archaeon]
MTDSDFSQLRLLEQNMGHLSSQKLEEHEILTEVKSALQDIDESKTSYKLVGKLMIAQDIETAKKELAEKMKISELKIKTIESQEKKLSEKMTLIQQELVKKDNKNHS